MKEDEQTLKSRLMVIFIVLFLVALVGVVVYLLTAPATVNEPLIEPPKRDTAKNQSGRIRWKAPNEATIPSGEAGDEIRYGKELIAHTSIYFGPKGKVAKISNGMNCQNCHSDAGTKPDGFNFSTVAATYPQFKNRSEAWVSISRRINSCFNRSLNGQSVDTAGKEMKAMVAYMNWLGKNIPKGAVPEDAEVLRLNYIDRAADPVKGKIVYATCETCHGKDGARLLNERDTEYLFPPLCGPHSYNDGAGMYRLENFAGFVQSNMPFGTDFKHPVLTGEGAWDVAAFVNSRPRPHKNQSEDYSVIGDKPIDFPFGPYVDNFSEKQHKYGPFKPILIARNKLMTKEE